MKIRQSRIMMEKPENILKAPQTRFSSKYTEENASARTTAHKLTNCTFPRRPYFGAGSLQVTQSPFIQADAIGRRKVKVSFYTRLHRKSQISFFCFVFLHETHHGIAPGFKVY